MAAAFLLQLETFQNACLVLVEVGLYSMLLIFLMVLLLLLCLYIILIMLDFVVSRC